MHGFKRIVTCYEVGNRQIKRYQLMHFKKQNNNFNYKSKSWEIGDLILK